MMDIKSGAKSLHQTEKKAKFKPQWKAERERDEKIGEFTYHINDIDSWFLWKAYLKKTDSCFATKITKAVM